MHLTRPLATHGGGNGGNGGKRDIHERGINSLQTLPVVKFSHRPRRPRLVHQAGVTETSIERILQLVNGFFKGRIAADRG